MKSTTSTKTSPSLGKRVAGILVLTVLGVLLLGIGYLAVRIWQYPNRPGPSGGPQTEIKVTITKNMSLMQVSHLLADKLIIQKPEWFRFYVNESGKASKIKVGTYSLSAQMTPRTIVQQLENGPLVQEKPVTIPEGKNMLEVAKILEQEGICPALDAEKWMRDVSFIQSLQLDVPDTAPTLEGYLFPDTYRFRAGSSSCKIPLQTMVKRMQSIFGKLRKDYYENLRVLNKQYHFSDRDVITMASIVEKETARVEERPRIAGVFLNRLRLPTFVPHKLETDPTIIYGCTVPIQKSKACEEFVGKIRRIHLNDQDNPYNTYTHVGLPPGPISNPGRAALVAVLKPDATPYLYFVSRNDGTHHFSVTLEEHQAAVNKYQRAHTKPNP